jgi:hypothetical protein
MKTKEEPLEITEARKKYKTIKVHSPTLDKNMRPQFELREYDENCNGYCSKCSHFKGVILTNGTVESYITYEGFCDDRTNSQKFIKGDNRG